MADYSSNFAAILTGHLGIDPEGGEGGKGGSTPTAPKNFKPLTAPERTEWNNFLNFLEKKGVGGSKDLDKKDQSLGLKYIDEYKKQNPDSFINKDAISRIQYDQFLLRKGDSYPTLNKEELQQLRSGLNPSFLARDVSDTDGWLGSITSKLYYPQARRGDNVGNHYNFGTDFESYVKGRTDPSLNEKYREK